MAVLDFTLIQNKGLQKVYNGRMNSTVFQNCSDRDLTKC